MKEQQINIVLIGFKSTGKTCTGKSLARLLDMRFVDTDDMVEGLYRERHQRSLTCREVYRELGAEGMRRLETEALGLALKDKGTVVATGGGTVLTPENLPLLRNAEACVFVDTPLPVLEKRLEKDKESPLFRARAVAELHAERLPRYLAAAGVRLVPEEGESPESVARRIRQVIKEKHHGE